jgi:F plasmid transfer operon, TraF, protein
MASTAPVTRVLTSICLSVGVCASTPAAAQSFDTVGTRAAGMGGAFVAVADDASAVYWNPAGLALGGALFSIVIDTRQDKARPDVVDLAGNRSATLAAIGTPPLGLSYYRLSSTRLEPALSIAIPGEAQVRLERLLTDHVGVTLVQSILPHVALGTTLKYVHGVAESGFVVRNANRDDLLDLADDLSDASTDTFDVDIGVMAVFKIVRAGVTIRNLHEPDFNTAGSDIIELKRQSRAGVAYVGVPGLIVSADFDIERARGSIGEERQFAAGAEAHLFPRAFFRTGFNINTLSDQPGGHAPVASVGGGYVIKSWVIDAHATFGSESGNRGWGVSGRLVY